MDNNTFPGGGIPQGNRTISTGEGEVPLAPPIQNATMRTMSSDIKSMKDSGGGAPIPYTPSIEKNIPSSQTPIPSTQPAAPIPPKTQSPFSQPPNNLPTKESFSFSGGVPSSPAPMEQQFPPEPIKSGSGAVKGIVAFLIVVAIGLAGYFFIYPYFSPSVTPQVPSIVVTTPPPVEPTTPVTPPETPLQPIVPPSKVLTHTSLFSVAADATTEAPMRMFSIASLKEAIPFTSVDVPILKEVVFRAGEPDGKGVIILFAEFAQLLAPQTFAGDVTKYFEPDFTYFVYSDKNGSWPGFVARFSSQPDLYKEGLDVTIPATKTKIQGLLESDGGAVSNFFLVNPGTAQHWKDGKINSVSTRYSAFSQVGASFNYGWLPNNLLLISTSYNGAKEAVRRLGL